VTLARRRQTIHRQLFTAHSQCSMPFANGHTEAALISASVAVRRQACTCM